MSPRWTGEQVLALAPDASSAAAGRRLATSAPWSDTGWADAAPGGPVVWGSCRGSGATPYLTAVDLTGPAFSCTCPSRKFPCKHALGLLLLWSAGGVPDAPAPPDRVAAWLAARQAASQRAASRGTSADQPAAASSTGPADPAAARERAERRDHRMLDGLAELDQWLHDQVRSGLAGTDRAGYGPFDPLAARMVDAQLPGVASTLRRLAGVAVSGDGWPARLLEEYALLHLLARAAPAALDGDDGELAATVRAHLGVPVTRQDVLATPAIRDRWTVLALRDDVEERLSVRRVWLHGARAGRIGLVLSFAMPGQALDSSLVPGTVVDAEVHRYPGGAGLRVLVGARYAVDRAAAAVPGTGLEAALLEWSQVLARDPWLRSWPVVLSGVVPVVDGDGWWLQDGAGSLPLVAVTDAAWVVLAASGGGPVTVLVELVPGGARLVALLAAAQPPSGPDPGPAGGPPAGGSGEVPGVQPAGVPR